MSWIFSFEQWCGQGCGQGDGSFVHFSGQGDGSFVHFSIQTIFLIFDTLKKNILYDKMLLKNL